MNADSLQTKQQAQKPHTTENIANHTRVTTADIQKYAAQGFTHVPITRQILADLDTPVSAFLKLARQPYSYLFESVSGGDRWGRYSIIGLPCEVVYSIRGYELEKSIAGKVVETQTLSDPLAKVRELQQSYNVLPLEGMPPMHGGLVGHFGYETVQYVEPRLAGQEPLDPIDTPDILLMVSEDVLVFDNVSGRMHLITLASTKMDVEAGEEQASSLNNAYAKLDSLEQKLRSELTLTEPGSLGLDEASPEFDVHFSQTDFEAAVEKCRDYIREGDIMQVVLSQRLSTSFDSDPFDIYRALRTINPSPYMYFIDIGDYQIVGSSPEILVSLRKEDSSQKSSSQKAGEAKNTKNVVTVRPIAGTRKRGFDQVEDLRLEKELLSDPKELAEHLMLIDLGRNDVGRIAQTGSVELTEKMIVERYSHVMHIVSNVEAELLPDMDAMDVLAATFPAGTVSGAPKIRAMEIIAELEPYKRGVYSGAIGYLGWNGNMDTAIAIRTAVVKGGRLYLQAGAGIVADSVPKYEWNETMSKAGAMIKAVEVARRGLKVGGV